MKTFLRDLWDNIKCTNIRIIGVPEGEETDKGPEKIFEEIIVKNFPNMGKEIATQVHEAQRVAGRINPRRNTPRHIVIKLTKIKGIFHRTRTKNFIICMETQKTPNSQSNLEKEKRSWRNQAP